MKFIKDISSRKFALKDLKAYIEANVKEVFSDKNRVHSYADFCRWPDQVVTDRNHLIMPGEYCLIDRRYNDETWIMICKFYGRDNGDRVKDIYPIIQVDDIYGKGFHCGYFLIPDISTP